MITSGLIGHTGFIGGNLAQQHSFRHCYHSTDIERIRGQRFDVLVCCAVAAAKWRANQFPEKDRAAIQELLEHLAYVKTERAILISTVDVYPHTAGVDEFSDCHTHPNHPYGTNRLYVEERFKQLFEDLLIVRLPGVFGPGLKKNVIFDLLHDNNLESINPDSVFQYYDVRRLWADTMTAEANKLRIVNLATEPILTKTIVDLYFSGKQIGASAISPAIYDIQTRYAACFGASGQYVYTGAQVLAQMGGYFERFHAGETG